MVMQHLSPGWWLRAPPDGRLLLSVPAYQWAWTQFDVDAGHRRRYTRKRLVRAVEAAGATVERATYIFAGTLPLFAAERIGRKLRRPADEPASLPEVSPAVERVLMVLCQNGPMAAVPTRPAVRVVRGARGDQVCWWLTCTGSAPPGTVAAAVLVHTHCRTGCSGRSRR
jgi:hypothetical protein